MPARANDPNRTETERDSDQFVQYVEQLFGRRPYIRVSRISGGAGRGGDRDRRSREE